MKRLFVIIGVCLILCKFVQGQDPDGHNRFEETGFAGIGDSNPLYHLHINGSPGNINTGIRLQNNFDGIVNAWDLTSTPNSKLKFNYKSSISDTIQKFVMTSTGKFGIGDNIVPMAAIQIGDRLTISEKTDNEKSMCYNAYANSTYYKLIDGISSALRFTSDGKIQLSWSGNASAGSQINWRDALTVLNNGNVGISTAAPSVPLEVNGKTKTTTLQITNGAGSNKLLTSDASGNATWVTPAWTINGNNIYKLTGNVGIGITNPNYPLVVNGTIGQSLVSPNDIFQNFSFTSTTSWRISKAEPARLIFNYFNGELDQIEYVLSLVGSGKVGINNTNPQYDLDIDGNINFTGQITHLGQTFNPSQWISDGNDISFIQGNVGIGTDNPTCELNVTGLAGENENIVHFHNNSGGSGGRTLYCTNMGGNIGPLAEFNNSGSGPVAIFNGGAVGIGTTETTGYKLAVAGKIHAEEVMVEHADNWYDFVFNENYDLQDIYELEKFVKQNKHLPDVPDEMEVKEKGINLGEMNGILLKKVEELTLYIIQQQKEIDELKQKIDD